MQLAVATPLTVEVFMGLASLGLTAVGVVIEVLRYREERRQARKRRTSPRFKR